jgi:ABC-type multidrug transport system fused ATPase/permease subunit
METIVDATHMSKSEAPPDNAVDSSNEYYEHLKRLKEMYRNYFRTPNVTLTWENVNVYRKESKRCFFFKQKSRVDDGEILVTGSSSSPVSVNPFPGSAGSRQQQQQQQHQNQQRSENSVIVQTSDRGTTTSGVPLPLYSNAPNESTSTDSIISGSSASDSSNMSSLTPANSVHILANADGIIRSGECLAIMGASGSGKTTLLNVLNFKNLKKFTVDAKIKLNGRLISESDLVNRSAYVQQDDLFIPHITVKEHLVFLVRFL